LRCGREKCRNRPRGGGGEKGLGCEEEDRDHLSVGGRTVRGCAGGTLKGEGLRERKNMRQKAVYDGGGGPNKQTAVTTSKTSWWKKEGSALAKRPRGGSNPLWGKESPNQGKGGLVG